MRRSEYKVSRAVYEFPLAYGIRTPEYEDEVVAPCGEHPHSGVGQPFPSYAGMRLRLVLPNCQRRVEQQHPLTCPAAKISVGRHRRTCVGTDLLEDIAQRRGYVDSGTDREAEPVGLPGTVIGILTDDDNFRF